MLAFERREFIIKELYKSKTVKVNELALTLNVTEETIRRDLKKLEEENIAIYVYGGARIVNEADVININCKELPYISRNQINIDLKRDISTKLLSLIRDNDTIMFDGSSTVLEAIKLLDEKYKNLTVITNSNYAIQTLQESELNIFCTGGYYRKKSDSLVGDIASENIKRFCVDKGIFSCEGISFEEGIMDSNEQEGYTKMAMAKQAKNVILLIDSSKFNKTSFVKSLDFNQVDYIITDSNPGKEWNEFLENSNIKLIY